MPQDRGFGVQEPATPVEPSAIDRAMAELSHKVRCVEEAWSVLEDKLDCVLIPQPPSVPAPQPQEKRAMCQLEGEISAKIEDLSTLRMRIIDVAARIQL